MGRLVLCNDDEAGGVLVQAVHYACAQRASDALQPGVEGRQCVGECVAPVAGAGVHDEPRGLVDDQEVVVLVLQVEWEADAP